MHYQYFESAPKSYMLHLSLLIWRIRVNRYIEAHKIEISSSALKLFACLFPWHTACWPTVHHLKMLHLASLWTSLFPEFCWNTNAYVLHHKVCLLSCTYNKSIQPLNYFLSFPDGLNHVWCDKFYPIHIADHLTRDVIPSTSSELGVFCLSRKAPNDIILTVPAQIFSSPLLSFSHASG